MKCSNCGHKQKDGAFCTNCGKQFTDPHVQQSDSSGAGLGISTPREEHIHNSQSQQKKNQMSFRKIYEKMHISKNDFLLPSYLVVAFILLIIGISWVAAFLLRTSDIVQDYAYIVFSTVMDVPDNVLIQLVTQLKTTIWDVLLVLHGGTYHGMLQTDDIEGMGLTWKLPVIIAPIILLMVFTFITRILRNRLHVSHRQLAKIMLFVAVLYSFVLIIVMRFMEPGYRSGDFVFTLTTSYFALWIHAFFLVGIAGFIGFKLWEIPRLKKSSLFVSIHKLKNFIKPLAVLSLIIGVVIIGMWIFIHPASIYTKPLTTPTSIWTVYHDDLLFYLMLPTFLTGELLYATGTSFVVTSQSLGELLQLPSGLGFHTLTGVSVIDGKAPDKELLSMIQSASRFIWYSLVSLIAFLFSLNRVEQRNWKEAAIQVIGIGILFAILASAVTFTFSSNTENINGMIGFHIITSGISVMVLSTIFVVIKNVITKNGAVKVGGHNE